MHCENFSIACRSLACCCGLGLPPLGCSFRHACWAFRNCGEFVSTPVLWPLLSTPLVILMCPELSGSGKFGTPCLRMHAEKAVGFPDFEAFPEDFPPALLFVEPICATPFLDPPPQPAASTASPTTTAPSATTATRGRASRQRVASCVLVFIFADHSFVGSRHSS